ncbi:MAG: hypothetical protein LBS86_07215 [Treponema sp.]|jgi:hypothetical protein|nr:hypothetical protein [Treponema sp.]
MTEHNDKNQHETPDVWDSSEQSGPPPVPLDAEPVFLYAREKRLEHASKAVREFTAPTPRKRFGLFNPLIAHPSQKSVLASILFLIAFIALISIVTKQTSTIKLGRNIITATARRDDGSTYITVTKTFKSDDGVYTGAVDIAAGIVARPKATTRKPLFPEREQRADEDHPIVADRIYFTLEPEEVYELVLPYEAADLMVFMQIDTERTTFRVKPK